MAERASRVQKGFLAGSKIALRAFAREDLAAYRRWLDDPRVTVFLEMGSRPSRDKDTDAFWKLASEAEDTIVFSIVEAGTGKLVGTCGLYLIQWACRRAQFNIVVGEPTVWDKGYGSEAARLILDYAFDTLNLNSVQLGVNADNKRAIRSYEKCGYVHEGVRRQFIFRNGRYYDVVMMSVLRDEYLAARKAHA